MREKRERDGKMMEHASCGGSILHYTQTLPRMPHSSLLLAPNIMSR